MAAPNGTAATGPWVFDPTLPDNGPKTLATIWPLFAVATIFLATRIWCKLSRRSGLWWDDYLLLGSWVAYTIAMIQVTINIHYGFGKPLRNINPIHAYTVGFGGMIVGTFVFVAPVLSKLSFIMTLSRIAGPRLKVALCIIAALVCSMQTVALVMQWTQCTPAEKIWNRRMPGGSCLPAVVSMSISMTGSAFSGVMDYVLAAVPWFVLKDLQMKKREKIGVALAMSVGVVAGTMAIVKAAKQLLLASADFTLEGPQLTIWSTTEISLSIVAASIPVLRTLFRDIGSSMKRGASGGGYMRSGDPSNTIGGGGGNNTLASKSRSAVRMSSKNGNLSTVEATSRVGGGGDNSPRESWLDGDSDRYILAANAKSGIVKTEEVKVDFRDRNDVHSMRDDYEMQNFGGSPPPQYGNAR